MGDQERGDTLKYETLVSKNAVLSLNSINMVTIIRQLEQVKSRLRNILPLPEKEAELKERLKSEGLLSGYPHEYTGFETSGMCPKFPRGGSDWTVVPDCVTTFECPTAQNSSKHVCYKLDLKKKEQNSDSDGWPSPYRMVFDPLGNYLFTICHNGEGKRLCAGHFHICVPMPKDESILKGKTGEERWKAAYEHHFGVSPDESIDRATRHTRTKLFYEEYQKVYGKKDYEALFVAEVSQ